MVDERKGKVWLVGAGPSDPGLITVKGLEVLQRAQVVVYDKLVGAEILNLIPVQAKKIDVGKRSNNHLVPQEKINQILLDEALAGYEVVRLKGGDPFLFGRGGEELELLQKNDIPFEIIPGVSSSLAVPAYAGIPVTHRDYCSSVHMITGHQKNEEELNLDFQALVQLKGTLVFMMGVATMNKICNGLIAAGMPPYTPAAIIEKGTTAQQRKIIAVLQDLPEKATASRIQAPAVIVVGQVCTLGETFSWAEKRPLHGIRVIVTRPQKLNSQLSRQIRLLGGEAIEFPCIKTIPIKDETLFHCAVSELHHYNWLVFTSAAGVEAFFTKLMEEGKDARQLSGLKIAVIGSGTAEALRQWGIKADYIPPLYNARDLGVGLVNLVKKEEKVMILRAKEGSQELTATLRESGISFLDVPVYETVLQEEGYEFSRSLIETGDFQIAAFTSASTVKGFVSALPDLDYAGVQALCIGEQTGAEARKHGMKVIISPRATIDSMVQTLVEYFHSLKEI